MHHSPHLLMTQPRLTSTLILDSVILSTHVIMYIYSIKLQ